MTCKHNSLAAVCLLLRCKECEGSEPDCWTGGQAKEGQGRWVDESGWGGGGGIELGEAKDAGCRVGDRGRRGWWTTVGERDNAEAFFYIESSNTMMWI